MYQPPSQSWMALITFNGNHVIMMPRVLLQNTSLIMYMEVMKDQFLLFHALKVWNSVGSWGDGVGSK